MDVKNWDMKTWLKRSPIVAILRGVKPDEVETIGEPDSQRWIIVGLPRIEPRVLQNGDLTTFQEPHFLRGEGGHGFGHRTKREKRIGAFGADRFGQPLFLAGGAGKDGR